MQDRSSRLRPFAWIRRLAHRRSPDRARANTKHPRETTVPESTKSKHITPSQQHSEAVVNHAPRRAQEQRPIGSIGSDQEVVSGRSLAENCRSMTPTVVTNPETIISEGDRQSKAGTHATFTGGVSSTSGGGNSVFSSPNHSNGSLTTTLTTIQSQATSTGVANHLAATQPYHQTSTYFSHQYPTGPVSALPAHLNPHQVHMPTTYRSATANNLLTDNASVITLASSSHRRQRRNSLDTDASIRAIRPSSVWGGSRESLPLSVLSQNVDSTVGASHPFPPTQSRLTGRDDRSLHSAAGVGAPALSSERNSIYAGKSGSGAADGASFVDGSVRSGYIGHVRNGSTAGSIGGYSNTWAGTKENIV